MIISPVTVVVIVMTVKLISSVYREESPLI